MLRVCSKREGVVLAESVGALKVDLKSQTKQLGAKEKARRKKCHVRFSLIRKHRVFETSYMKTGVRKVLRTGLIPASAWGGQAVGTHMKVEIEEADGGSSRRK